MTTKHCCTYCRGHNAHNCQFNTQLPRVQTYITNHTSPPKREWQGLTEEEWGEIAEIAPNIGDAIRMTQWKLKEKNG